MLQLRTLGALELGEGDPSRQNLLLRQPRLVGLLAFLALTRNRSLHHRDSLMAMFWPEADAFHARHSLSQALHLLRRYLGSELVIARGAEEVGLAPDRIWVDAIAF